MTVLNKYDINWFETKHAFGSGADIPEIFEKIQNSNRDISKQYAQQLLEKICHQEVIEDITILLINPIVDLLVLKKKSIPKCFLINSLTYLIRCSSKENDILGFAPFRKAFRGAFSEKKLYKEEERKIKIEKKINSILRKRINDIFSLMNEKDINIKSQLSFLISILGYKNKKIQNKFSHRYKHETNSIVLANYLLTSINFDNTFFEKRFDNIQKEPLLTSVNNLFKIIKMQDFENEQLFKTIVDELISKRYDYTFFPWCDGSITHLFSQILTKFTTSEFYLKVFLEAINKLTELNDEQININKTEERIYWGWTSEMLLANQILVSVFEKFIDTRKKISYKTLTKQEIEILMFLTQKNIELPILQNLGLNNVIDELD